jgi:uncharacterized protein (DUF885 family)
MDIDDFADEILKGAFSDALSVNFLLTNPDSYGVGTAEAAWPRPSTRQEYSESLSEITKQLRLVRKLIRYEGDKQKELYDFLMNYMDSRAEDFKYYYFQDDYLGSYISMQANIPVLLSEYRLRNAGDIDNVVAYMEDTQAAFASYISYEHEKIDNGYGRGAAFYRGALNQTKAVLGVDQETRLSDATPLDASGHFLRDVFDTKIEQCAFLTEAQKGTALARISAALEQGLLPAYLQLGLELQNIIDNTPQSQLKTQGLRYYDEGQSYYEHLFKTATGCSDSVPAALEKLYAAYGQVQADIDALEAQIKLDQGSEYDIQQGISMLIDADDWTETGLQNILERLNADILGNYPDYPQNQVRFSFVDESLKDNYSPAAYFRSPIDDLYAEESIIINKSGNDESESPYLLFDLLAHEGIPGHMYQTAYLKSRTDMHAILQVMTPKSYSEGWATYAQYQFAANAFQSENNLENQLFHYYQLENLRGGYLQTILDIQIHYEGMSLEAMAASFGMAVNEDLEEAYNQILETPTNAATYFYSYIKLMEIKTALLEKGYSELAFHEAILSAPYTYDQIKSIYGV